MRCEMESRSVAAKIGEAYIGYFRFAFSGRTLV